MQQTRQRVLMEWMARGLFSLLVVLCVVPPSLPAQTATGRLSGTVLDSTGAAIPGAAVTVRSETSGLAVWLETDAAGGFIALALPSGQYSVEAEAEAFQRQIVRTVKVDVARETSLPPIRLEIGSITESIEVKGGVSQVQTTTAEISSTVTMDQIQHLPLIGRGALNLIYLEAGVAFQGRTPTVINGQRTSFSNVTLDGINIQDNYIRDNGLNFSPNRPLVDQVSEFTITTQNGGAAFGGGSSQVNLTTHAGTNDFHGNLYWHNRNTRFSANQWFSNRTGTPKPFLNRNQAGGSLGGPIVKNRLLFYTNYELTRERAEVLTNTRVLTADAREGIFTYRDGLGQVRKANVLQLARVPRNEAVMDILEDVPGPEAINNFDVGDSDPTLLRNTAGHQFNVRSNKDRDAVTNRLDYVLSEQHWLSGTYQFTRDQPDRPSAGVGYSRVPPVKEFSHTHLLSLGWGWTPGPHWTNELRAGFNLAPGEFRTTDQLPSHFLTGFLFDNPVVDFEPEGRATDTYNLVNNTARQAGTHSLRFGGSAQRVHVETYRWGGTIPTYGIGINILNPLGLNATQFPGGISNQDLDAAEALLTTIGGLISNGTQTFNIADRGSGFIPGQEFRRRYSLNSYGFYGQDSWRVSPALTLSLGLRWEYTGRAEEEDGLWLSPVVTSGDVRETLLTNATLDFAGDAVGRPLYEKDLNNFAPNIGIAWDLFGTGKTSLRVRDTASTTSMTRLSSRLRMRRLRTTVWWRRRRSPFLDRLVGGPLPYVSDTGVQDTPHCVRQFLLWIRSRRCSRSTRISAPPTCSSGPSVSSTRCFVTRCLKSATWGTRERSCGAVSISIKCAFARTGFWMISKGRGATVSCHWSETASSTRCSTPESRGASGFTVFPQLFEWRSTLQYSGSLSDSAWRGGGPRWNVLRPRFCRGFRCSVRPQLKYVRRGSDHELLPQQL